MMEPRTNLEMWEDALELLREREFEDRFDERYQRSYTACGECHEKDWDDGKPNHADDCRMARALKELTAFVAVEQRLENERREREENE
jgi:phage terminase Nu1 subunit (DNA packaging protein)